MFNYFVPLYFIYPVPSKFRRFQYILWYYLLSGNSVSYFTVTYYFIIIQSLLTYTQSRPTVWLQLFRLLHQLLPHHILHCVRSIQ